MKAERIALVAPAWLKDELVAISKTKKISMSEYIKDALKDAVARDRQQPETGK